MALNSIWDSTMADKVTLSQAPGNQTPKTVIFPYLGTLKIECFVDNLLLLLSEFCWNVGKSLALSNVIFPYFNKKSLGVRYCSALCGRTLLYCHIQTSA